MSLSGLKWIVPLFLVAAMIPSGFTASDLTVGQSVTYTTTVWKTTTVYQTVTVQSALTSLNMGDPGTTRLNPLPLGKKLVVGDWTFSVVSLERDAYGKIKSMNIFNSEPKPDKEAILVKIEAKLNLGPNDKGKVSLLWFKVVGEKSIVYERRWDVLEPKLDQEIFGGATIQGYVSFDVAKGEKGLVLMLRDVWYLSLE